MTTSGMIQQDVRQGDATGEAAGRGHAAQPVQIVADDGSLSAPVMTFGRSAQRGILQVFPPVGLRIRKAYLKGDI